MIAAALAFVIGIYTRQSDLEQAARSLRALRRSQEYRDLTSALRTCGANTLRTMADVVEGGFGDEAEPGGDDLLGWVRSIVGGRPGGGR